MKNSDFSKTSKISRISQNSQKIVLLLIFSVLSLIVMMFSPLIGMKWIKVSSVFHFSAFTLDSLDAEIFWRLRMPRTVLSFLAGAGLAVSGMAFQAMFKNPLATPFTLGVSSGASFGAVLYVYLGLMLSLFGIPGITWFAFLGAIVSILIVYALAKRGHFSSETMLLAGVAVSFSFSSLILFIHSMSHQNMSFRMIRWLMGGIDPVGWDSILNLFPFLLIGWFIIFYLKEELNLMAISDEIAISRGVDLKKTKRLLFFATSLMVGGIVSFCGPIGFIGMIVPHISRLLIGPEHKHLTFLCFLTGGLFLCLCDTFSRTVFAPTEIPIGVITGLLGGPFFIWLLLEGRVKPQF